SSRPDGTKLLSPPAAESPAASGFAREIQRSGLTCCRHAEADFVFEPFHDAEGDLSGGELAHIQVVHRNGRLRIVDPDFCVDHYLSAKYHFRLVLGERP